MLANLKLAQKGLIVVLLPLLFQLAFIYELDKQLDQAEYERSQQALYREKKEHLNKIMRLIMDGAAGTAIYGISVGDPSTQRRYKTANEALQPEFAFMAELSKNNPEELKNIGMIKEMSQKIGVRLKSLREQVDLHNVALAMAELRALRPEIGEVNKQVEQLVKAQERLENSHVDDWSERRAQVKRQLMFGILVNILLAILFCLWIYRSTARRLATVVDNSMRLASGVDLLPPLKGTDEIAQLDRTFNAMAKTLKQAVKKERAIIENAVDVICSIDEKAC